MKIKTVIFSIIATLIIVSILFYTLSDPQHDPRDAGIMQVSCGGKNYDYHWGVSTILYHIQPIAGDGFIKPVERELKAWNERLGVEVFKPSDSEYLPDKNGFIFGELHINLTSNALKTADAHTIVIDKGSCELTGLVMASQVRVDIGYIEDDLGDIVKHELGHVLGLAHDHTRESIMYPKLVKGAKVLKADIELLQGLYR